MLLVLLALDELGDALVADAVNEAPLSVGVGSTTVTEIGGAVITEIDVGAPPVPCGSFELNISKAPLQLVPSSCAFTV